MDARLERLEEKLDKVLEIQTELKVDVAEHIRRTEIAEANIDKLAESLKPIQEHVAFIRGLGKLVSWIVGIATAIGSLIMTLRGGK